MPKYRYEGPVPVKCAGRLWKPGDQADAALEINHPHFVRVRPTKVKEIPDADN